MKDLNALRQRLNELDRQLLHLAAERHRITDQIGAIKRASGQPTRDYEREREVIELARAEAASVGLPTDLAEALMRRLIRASLVHQEQASVSATDHGRGRSALVIGGGGKMGRWFAEFLASQGFDVVISDPACADNAFSNLTDWRSGNLDYDLIVIATPLGVTEKLLHELAALQPAGLLMDIASLKTPIRKGLEAAAAAGCRVVSLHPMFGPDTELLSGRHVIFIDLGAPDAVAEARALFEPTMVETAEMDLDEHDKLIAFVLGLSHALNIAFFNALVESGQSVPRLAEISSTTFDAQLAVSSRVSEESPEVYYEIQSLNEHGRDALDALEQSLTKLRAVIDGGDQAAFARIMQRGRDYLSSKRAE
ncbi:MAG: prephenate dehydrogenase/arogenate dehydrogenase family protein [Gammaproteobacteria bacterium]|nr:prephenate dehydrogenase/arogenate dehydrogenase family protein [Gammaproteobacteria bacterium]NNM20698.1 prephenate dehydrogenase/arogenate dehydrogenase family protein [Gammaproteobacteria bacterium]